MYENILNGFSSYILLEKNLSKNTKLSYVRDVKKFLEYCDKNNISFVSIKPLELENYLFSLKNKGYKINSLFRKTESIRAFYKYLLIDGKITENPLSSFKPPRPDKKLPEFLSIDDIEKLLSVFKGDRFNGIRSFAIMDLLYSSGMRVSEVCDLVMESVNLTQLWIRVIGKGNKERIVPINENTAGILKIYISERNLHFANKEADSYLFLNKSGKKLSRVQIWKDIKKLAKEAGIKKNVYPHLFRHTFATHLLNGGADLKSISEMLGHSSLTTTQIYTHLDNRVIKSMHKKYHPKG
ncbi:MAG: site-specific tyrosine recombinase/integron integrase [Elusimicrobiota bacterium]